MISSTRETSASDSEREKVPSLSFLLIRDIYLCYMCSMFFNGIYTLYIKIKRRIIEWTFRARALASAIYSSSPYICIWNILVGIQTGESVKIYIYIEKSIYK